jgi:hypothetical protein
LTADLSRLHVTVSNRFLKKLAAAKDALSHSRPGATNEGVLEAGLDALLERYAKRKGLLKRPRKADAGGTMPPSVAAKAGARRPMNVAPGTPRAGEIDLRAAPGALPTPPAINAAAAEAPAPAAPAPAAPAPAAPASGERFDIPAMPADADPGGYIPADVRREVWIRDRGCCQWPLAYGGICASTHRAQFDQKIARALGGKSTVENVRVLCRFHNDLAARQTFGDAHMDQFTRNPRAQPGPGPTRPRS